MLDMYDFKRKILLIFTITQIILALMVTKILNLLFITKSNSILAFLVSLTFYIVFFITPIVLHLKLIDKVSVLQYLKLTENIKSGILKGLIIGGFIFVVILAKNQFEILRQVNFHEDIVIILGKLLVGPLEEIPFRGFYLQKFQEYMKFWKANLISSLLFASVHIPNFMGGTLISFYPILLILIVGLWMGYILKETKSLWCVSIVHSMYDLAILIIL